MIVHITYITFGRYFQEIELIEQLCKYEQYTVEMIYSYQPEFKKYYKGGHPAVLIYETLTKDPTVVYGFWAFAQFLITRGMLLC